MSTAQDRGWGLGWPATRFKDMVAVTAGGITVPVHRQIAPLVAWLVDETSRRGYKLVAGWCWGYACRAIGGTSIPSNHSWGLAVDLNAPKNPMGPTLRTDMPLWMPELWETWGFRWGGRFSGRKDAMHYEFMGSPTDAVRFVSRLGAVPGKIEEAKVARLPGRSKYGTPVGKGVVGTNELGEIYCWNTTDHGGYNRLTPEQRQGTREIIGIYPDSTNAPDGYVQVADDGSRYTFPL